ncbi:MAG: tetratricopeptide repeat protein [Bacteroidales bacterium]
MKSAWYHGWKLLLLLWLGSTTATAQSSVKDNGVSAPMADTVAAQQRDSVLFNLNLEYLNGVNEHKSPFELIPIIKEILTLDAAQYNQWFNLGMEYIKIKEFYLAADAFNQGLELYPSEQMATLEQIYLSLSFCYHKTERHQKELEILDMLAEYHPHGPAILGRYMVCSHYRMRFTEEEDYRNQLVSVLRDKRENESDIAYYLGRLYLNEDYLEAEKYFTIAYHYDPENVEKMGALAWVLIMNALRINEGMALMKKAIEADPDNPVYIHQLGYAYYIKGDYKDALENLMAARELYQEYSYELDNHIRLVEEAIALLEDQSI